MQLKVLQKKFRSNLRFLLIMLSQIVQHGYHPHCTYSLSLFSLLVVALNRSNNEGLFFFLLFFLLLFFFLFFCV